MVLEGDGYNLRCSESGDVSADSVPTGLAWSSAQAMAIWKNAGTEVGRNLAHAK